MVTNDKVKKRKQRAKRRPERFKIIKRNTQANTQFFMSMIEWKNATRPLLVSIPRGAGPAVMRNRWKRLVKEWFYSEGLTFIPGQSLWIRFNRTKNLMKPLLSSDWHPLFTKELRKLMPLAAS